MLKTRCTCGNELIFDPILHHYTRKPKFEQQSVPLLPPLAYSVLHETLTLEAGIQEHSPDRHGQSTRAFPRQKAQHVLVRGRRTYKGV